MYRFNNPMFLALAEDTMDEETTRSMTVRLPVTLVAYLDAMAEANGRTRSDEVLDALQVHRALHRLSLTLDQQIQRGRKQASRGVHGVTGDSAYAWAQAQREKVTEAWARSMPAAYQAFRQRFPGFLWAEDPREEDRAA